MRYPNLRYGNPAELAYYVQGVPIKDVARRLKRSERTVKNWLSGKEKMPWWVNELLRLQGMEKDIILRQMGFKPMKTPLGIVGQNAEIHPFRPAAREPKPATTDQEKRRSNQA